MPSEVDAIEAVGFASDLGAADPILRGLNRIHATLNAIDNAGRRSRTRRRNRNAPQLIIGGV
jgi:hypothetical protein